MINLNAFKKAHGKYNNKEIPFLMKQSQINRKTRQYQGLKILHNTPLTVEAVLKIEPLVLGGADVTISCITALPPQEEAVRIIQEANIKLQIDHNFSETYDIHLDCCGELIHTHPPRIGTVELTQTGSELYKDASHRFNYPVISIDDSSIKKLETFYGTGEGFIRALYRQVGQDMYDKSYVVFGFGKVGKGIVHALKKYTNKIFTIVDIDVAMMGARSCPGVKFIHGDDLKRVKDAIKTAYCVITATGVEGVISQYYGLTKKNFDSAILTNMGADDEYGHHFKEDDVLFEKKPFNFSISEPTTMKYLDPVFYAHNMSIDLLLSGKIANGYNRFPEDLSADILSEWNELHNEYEMVA